MDQFQVRDNCLLVGDIPLPRLAHRVGQTPFYAYDRQIMTQRVETLNRRLPDEVSLHYAVKANPMPAVVQHMSRLTNGLDVASLREMRTALDTGTPPNKISFAGPGKADIELRAAIAASVIINAESAAEVARIARLGDSLSIRPRVAIRVNPDFQLKTSGMKMSGGPKPFGVDAEQVPALLRRMKSYELDFQGFHIFSGSQNLRPESIIEAQTQTLDLATRLADDAPSPVKWLNLGGGFGIPYFPGDQRLDLQPIADNLANLVREYRPRLPEAEFVIELGRYLVGEAGIYVCEVIDVKESRGETFAVTNGGLHHHLSASGNFGQLIRKNYPVCIGNRVTGADTGPVNVVGPLCTPLDILADKYSLPRVDVGDLIVVFQSGAYGYTASPQDFLSHPEPIEVLV
jgi:diaminopimelate decarboxylase